MSRTSLSSTLGPRERSSALSETTSLCPGLDARAELPAQACAVANMLNLLNPSVVVLGGALTSVGECLLHPLRQILAPVAPL